jgi:DNA modification methylase
LQPNQTIIGDAREVLKTFDNECVHLTWTSPPYFNAKDYSSYDSYQHYLDFLQEVFVEVFRVTKAGRMCVVNVSPVILSRECRQSESKRLPIPFHFFTLMETLGWKYLEDIVWAKPEGASANRNGGFFQNRKPVAYKPNIVTETIFVFQKPADFLIDKIVQSYDGDILEKSLINTSYERSNIWEIAPATGSDHPAPFPKELSDKVIMYYSFVGDLILDPFMGSGTTAQSCVDLRRNYLGVELHEKYPQSVQFSLL